MQFRSIVRSLDVLAIVVGLSVFFSSLIAALFIYEQAVRSLDGVIRDRLTAMADLAARLTDGDRHASLTRPEQKDTADYAKVQAPYLQILHANPDLIYVYTVVDCGGRACIVMDAELPHPGEHVEPSGVMQIYEQPSSTLMRALKTQRAAIEPQPYTDEYGTFLTAYAPIYTSSHRFLGVVGVDMSEKQLRAKIAIIRSSMAAGLVIAALISAGIAILVAVLRRRNRRLDRKFRTVATNIPAVLFECRLDDDLTMTYVNNHIETVTGYGATDFTSGGRTLAGLIPPSERTQVLKDIRAQIDRGPKFEVEFRLARGEDPKCQVWVRMSGVTRTDADGAALIAEGFMQDITLRKAGEAKLAESELQFRGLADSTPNLLWITDTEGDALFFNKTWLTFVGRSIDEAMDDGWTAPLHADDVAICQDKFAEAARTQTAFQCWFRLLRHDGVHRWMLADCTPKFTGSGRFDGFICAATDITDRKAFEARLKRSNSQLELFFRYTPAAIAVLDEYMRYVAVSERWKVDFHLGDDDLIGRSHFEVFPSIPQRWKNDLRQCLEGKRRHCEEDSFLRADRTLEWLTYDLHPWHEEGQVRGVIMFVEVISEKKRLYDELRRHRDDLQSLVQEQTFAIRAESEKNILLRQTISAANVASGLGPALAACVEEICRFADWPLGRCLLVDVETEILAPGSPWIGETAEYPDAEAVLAQAEPQWMAAAQQAVQTRSVIWTRLADSLVSSRAGGIVASPIILESRVVGVFLFFDPAATSPAADMVALLTDIGLQYGRVVDRFYQDHTLRLARDAAEESARAKAEFLSNMSHELRTPMHAILNYAGMGVKRLSHDIALADTEKLARYLGNIQSAGTRLLGLLNNLLDLAKMESGKMAYHFETRDLKAAIDHTCMELDSLIHARKLTLAVDYAVDSTLVRIDFDRVVQVMVNLFSNAIRYSPEEGHLHLNVVAAGAGDPSSLIVSLTDDGEGIPDGELDDIFSAFTQSSATKSGAGGTGLGLSICREIVSAHGGRIWAENIPGKGARISFTLPAAAARATPVAA